MSGLVLDVGNTHVHAVWFAGEDVVAEEILGDEGAVEGLLDRCPSRWVVGSVHPRVDALVERLRRSGAPAPLRIRGAADVPLSLRVREPERVGVDRLASALAAIRAGRRDAVVVDVGTAVTVDWVRAAGIFEGGAIGVGRRAAMRGLAASAAQLPELPLQRGPRPAPLPGRSTEEAMAAALELGLPAAIDALVSGLIAQAGDPDLWLTGGDADWYRARSRHRFRGDRHLVAKGLWLAAGEGGGSRG